MPLSKKQLKILIKSANEGIGEAFHTAFRKGTDCKQAHPIWVLIRDMDPKDWEGVLGFTEACMEQQITGALKEAYEQGYTDRDKDGE